MKKTFFVLASALVIMFGLTLAMGCKSGRMYDSSLAISAVDGEYKNFTESIENAEEAVSKLPETTGVLALAEIKSVKRNATNMYNLCTELGAKINSCQKALTKCETANVESRADVKSARKFGFYAGIGLTVALYTLLLAVLFYFKAKLGGVFGFVRKFFP